jgi:hypothetical protein
VPRMLTLLVSGSLLLPAAAAAQTEREPSSGVEFPTMLNGQQLMGTAIRTKTFLKVKVYAYGYYVDPAAARTALSRFAGHDAAALAQDDAFYSALLQMTVPMSLRLVMTRNVSGDQMREAFDEVLRPRVVSVAARMPGGEAALDQFRTYFSLDRLHDGAVLDFTCTPDGVLHTSVGGETKPPITSRALCWALFDVYLGEHPIMSQGKRTVIAHFPDLLGTH